MRHGIFVICCLFLIQIYQHGTFTPVNSRKINIGLSKANQGNGLYLGLVTGDKSKISYSLKQKLKSLGMLHLFTPSGLHLSSLFFIKYLPPRILTLALLFLLVWLGRNYDYDSMERVLVFKLLFNLAPKISLNKTFLMTFLISIFGGHMGNPLSILYSLLFWGTILIYRNNKPKCLFYLGFQNLLLSTLAGEQANLLVFLINPLITFITSLFFPFFLANSLLPRYWELNFSPYFRFIESVVMEADFALVSLSLPTFLFGTLIFLKLRMKASYLYLFLFIPSAISLDWEYTSSSRFHLAPSHSHELMNIKENKLEFIDRSCNWELNCKRKKIEWGGLKI